MRENRSSTTDSSGVPNAEWSPRRKLVASLVTSAKTELVLAALVFLGLILVIIETDQEAKGLETPPWLAVVENILLLLYSVEMVLRVFALRASLLETPLNVLDLVVVVIDAAFFFSRLASTELPSIACLRVMRLMKLSRTSHILISQEQLYIMVEALVASFKTTFFGCLFIAVALLIYSIIAVQFLRPMDVAFSSTCGRCPVAFDSVYDAMTTLVQTNIIGDEWGDVFLPFLDEHPSTLAFILVIFVTINFGIMNLIVAGIVDSAAQARIHNAKRIVAEKEKEYNQQRKLLMKLCQDMDKDGSNTITIEELGQAYDSNVEFKRTLRAMDIEREDLDAVFNILDQDSSGDIEYSEFVQQLFKMKTNDASTTLVFLKHYVTEIRKRVSEEMVILKTDIAGGISQLQNQMVEELQLLKSDIAPHENELRAQQVTREFDAGRDGDIFEDGGQAFENWSALESQVSTQWPPVSTSTAATLTTGISPNFAKHDATETQLQMATYQIAAAVEELRQKCETNVVLLSRYHGMLPRMAIDDVSTLRKMAKVHDSDPLTVDGTKLGSSQFRLPCCREPHLARSNFGTRPLPAVDAGDPGVLSKPDAYNSHYNTR